MFLKGLRWTERLRTMGTAVWLHFCMTSQMDSMNAWWSKSLKTMPTPFARMQLDMCAHSVNFELKDYSHSGRCLLSPPWDLKCSFKRCEWTKIWDTGDSWRVPPPCECSISCKNDRLTEWFITLRTFERFLPGMHKQMSFQVTCSGRCVGTQGKAEWFLPCMSSYVFPQMNFTEKDLVQKEHLKSFSPVCTITWSRRRWSVVNVFIDNVHSYEAFLVHAFVLR